jgi:hypothetical protein
MEVLTFPACFYASLGITETLLDCFKHEFQEVLFWTLQPQECYWEAFWGGWACTSGVVMVDCVTKQMGKGGCRFIWSLGLHVSSLACWLKNRRFASYLLASRRAVSLKEESEQNCCGEYQETCFRYVRDVPQCWAVNFGNQLVTHHRRKSFFIDVLTMFGCLK